MAAHRVTGDATFAFTLPISCQICLGKVKQPVVCPNQHVFCSPCLELWLERNKQCPACRVDISEENPFKKILGGLNQNEEQSVDSFTNKELRKARVDLLIKEYENEVERLNNELTLLQNENEVLTEKLETFKKTKKNDGSPAVEKARNPEEISMLVNLTNKLDDATNLYEKVKNDIQNLKKENYSMREGNIDLTRENERLRLELTKRSPRKFGRYTVATLETKSKEQDREIVQLRKALENSDECIEEKETEIHELKERCANCIICRNQKPFEKTEDTLEVTKDGDTLDQEKDSDNERGSGERERVPQVQFKEEKRIAFYPPASQVELPSFVANIIDEEGRDKSEGNMVANMQRPVFKQRNSEKTFKSKTQKLTKTDKKRLQQEDSSFFLEMPSPLTPSSSLGKLSMSEKNSPNKSELEIPSGLSVPLGRSDGDSLALDFSNQFEGTIESERFDSCRKKLKFESDISSFEKPSANTTGQDSFLGPVRSKDKPTVQSRGSQQNYVPSHQMSREFQEANISYTPELADCIELFKTAEQNIAEKKVPNTGPSRTWSFNSSSAVTMDTGKLMRLSQPNHQNFLNGNTSSLKTTTTGHAQDRHFTLSMPTYQGTGSQDYRGYLNQNNKGSMLTNGMPENTAQVNHHLYSNSVPGLPSQPMHRQNLAPQISHQTSYHPSAYPSHSVYSNTNFSNHTNTSTFPKSTS